MNLKARELERRLTLWAAANPRADAAPLVLEAAEYLAGATMTKREIQAAEYAAESVPSPDDVVEGTLRLTRRQWEALVCHVENDVALAEVGLSPHIGREAMKDIIDTANAVTREVKRATGIDGGFGE